MYAEVQRTLAYRLVIVVYYVTEFLYLDLRRYMAVAVYTHTFIVRICVTLFNIFYTKRRVAVKLYQFPFRTENPIVFVLYVTRTIQLLVHIYITHRAQAIIRPACILYELNREKLLKAKERFVLDRFPACLRFVSDSVLLF